MNHKHRMIESGKLEFQGERLTVQLELELTLLANLQSVAACSRPWLTPPPCLPHTLFIATKLRLKTLTDVNLQMESKGGETLPQVRAQLTLCSPWI